MYNMTLHPERKYTWVYHVADIHIHEKINDNILHSWELFVRSIQHSDQSLVVIAGDVFESKVSLGAEDLIVFHKMMRQLEELQVPTFIIPGNHDYGLYSDKPNLCEAAICDSQYVYIHVITHSGVVSTGNIDIHAICPQDQVIPEVRDSGRKKIALIHESIRDATFCNGFISRKGRFNAPDLSEKYDIVCLGDIHKQQFMAPNVAYCGSFVQKNRGEDLNHGYILWSIESCAGKFCTLPILHPYIRIAAADDSADPLPDLAPREVTVHHMQCTQEYIAQLKLKLLDKYGNIPLVFIDDNVPTDVEVEALPDIEDACSHISLFAEYVADYPDKEKIIEVYERYLRADSESHQENTVFKWKLEFLAWEGVFKYRGSNYIQFSRLNGLVSLFGPNASGKSSIIEIILFVMFNHCARGAVSDVVHCEAKHGSITCIFEANGVRYLIRRRVYRVKGTMDIVFMRYDDESKKFVNIDISAKSGIDVYRAIGQIVGTIQHFESTIFALQSRQSFIDKTQMQQRALLIEYLGIEKLHRINKAIRADETNLRTQMQTLRRQLPDEIGALHDRARELRLEHSELKRRYTDMQSQARSLREETDRLRLQFDSRLDVDCAEEIGAVSAETLEQQLAVWKQEVAELQLPESSSLLLGHSSAHDRTEELSASRKKLQQLQRDLEDCPAAEAFSAQHVDNTLTSEEIEVIKRAPPEKTTDELRALRRNTAALDFHFEKGCKACRHNRGILSESDALFNQAIDNQIKQAEKYAAAVATEMHRRQQARNECERRYQQCRQQHYIILRDCIAHYSNLHLLATRRQQVDENASIKAKIEKNARELACLSADQEEINDQIIKLNRQMAEFEQYEKISVEYSALEEQHRIMHILRNVTDTKNFPRRILEQQVTDLFKKINHTLSRLCDFNISNPFLEDSKSSRIMMDNNISIGRASGGQRFILDLAIRHAMAQVNRNRLPSMLIIDEGFGALDNNNRANINEFLNKLKTEYKFILIISHISDSHTDSDTALHITQTEGCSQLQFGNSKILQAIASASASAKSYTTSAPADSRAVPKTRGSTAPDSYIEERGDAFWCSKCCVLLKKNSVNAHKKSLKHNR